MRRPLFALLVLIMIGGAASAQFFYDDYNGYTGSTLGNWKEYLGDWNAVNGTAESAQVRAYQYLVWEDPKNDIKLKDCVAECMVYYNPKSSQALQFGGVALRVDAPAANTSLIHVKVQDNDSSGDFDSIWLYERPGSSTSKTGITGFKQARVRMTCLDQKAYAEIDVDGDGVWDHTVLRTVALPAKAARVGLCAYGGAQMDNFKVFNAVLAGSKNNPKPQPGQVMTLVMRATPKATYQAATSYTSGSFPVPGGVKVPLAPDPLFILSVKGLPTIFQNYANYLDASGNGSIKIALPKVTALVGVRLYSTFVTYSTFAVQEVSNDYAFTVVS